MQNNNTNGYVKTEGYLQDNYYIEISPVWIDESNKISLSVKSLVNHDQEVWKEEKQFVVDSGQTVLIAQETNDNEDTLFCLLTCNKGTPDFLQTITSNENFRQLANEIFVYANDNEGNLPENLNVSFQADFKPQWYLDNVEYLGKGRKVTDKADTVIAYDKSLLTKNNGTNVLFLDGHTEFCSDDYLEKLGILAPAVQIETRLVTVPADSNFVNRFLEKIGKENKKEQDSNSLYVYLNDEKVEELIRFIQTYRDAKILTAPRVTVLDGETSLIGMTNKVQIIVDVDEKDLDDKGDPKPIAKDIEVGTKFYITPKLVDNENIHLEFKAEISEITGYEKVIFQTKIFL